MRKLTRTTDNQKTVRHNWGRTYSTLPELDLLAVQKNSYRRFQDTMIGDILHEISPIDDFTGKNWSLTLQEYRIGKPTVDPETALIKGLTYDAPLNVKVTLINKKTDKKYQTEVFLGDIPQMTTRGT